MTAEQWRQIHSRTTYPVPGVRFYAHAWNSAYAPTRESAADALTQQALASLDFPAIRMQAEQRRIAAVAD